MLLCFLSSFGNLDLALSLTTLLRISQISVSHLYISVFSALITLDIFAVCLNIRIFPFLDSSSRRHCLFSMYPTSKSFFLAIHLDVSVHPHLSCLYLALSHKGLKKAYRSKCTCFSRILPLKLIYISKYFSLVGTSISVSNLESSHKETFPANS